MRSSGAPDGTPDLLQPLRDPRAWRIALTVGTLINAYGQLLVPWLDGKPDVFSGWLERASSHPGTTALSTLLGYLFPLGVSIYSAAGARGDGSSVASRAQLSDARPDPVFRADARGEFLELGERTRQRFAETGVTSALELLGAEAWERVRSGAPQGMRVHLARLGGWFLLSHAPGFGEGINVYLTPVASEETEGAATS